MARYVLPNDPALSGASVTPSNTADLPNFARMLYVGTSGHIKVTTLNGDEITLMNVPVGVLMVQARRVWATGTTALNIVALW